MSKKQKEKSKKSKKKKKKKPYKLYVGNVAYSANEENLREKFEEFGNIIEIIIPRKTTRHMGFSFITFDSTKSGENARQAMHRKRVFGRKLKCQPALIPKAVDWARKKAFLDRERSKLMALAASILENVKKSSAKKTKGKTKKKISEAKKSISKKSKKAAATKRKSKDVLKKTTKRRKK